MSEADASGEDGFRFGYVALVGRPNVGKSTLMNRILGHKISIVTHKPQTTRHRIAGIKTTARGQVVYVDTPGIHRAAGRALNRYMNRVAHASFRDVELVLFIIEAGRWTGQDRAVARLLSESGRPVFAVINKIDLVPNKRELLAFVANFILPSGFDEVFMVSALNGDGVEDVERRVLEVLPFSMPFYNEDQITDRSERFLAAEILREALTLRLHQEMPYAVTAEIESFERSDGVLRIGALIWVERDSQKQIVIGKGGQTLKQIGSEARRALEDLFGQQVYLRTWVKVSKDWTRSERMLERLGYDE